MSPLKRQNLPPNPIRQRNITNPLNRLRVRPLPIHQHQLSPFTLLLQPLHIKRMQRKRQHLPLKPIQQITHEERIRRRIGTCSHHTRIVLDAHILPKHLHRRHRTLGAVEVVEGALSLHPYLCFGLGEELEGGWFVCDQQLDDVWVANYEFEGNERARGVAEDDGAFAGGMAVEVLDEGACVVCVGGEAGGSGGPVLWAGERGVCEPPSVVDGDAVGRGEEGGGEGEDVAASVAAVGEEDQGLGGVCWVRSGGGVSGGWEDFVVEEGIGDKEVWHCMVVRGGDDGGRVYRGCILVR